MNIDDIKPGQKYRVKRQTGPILCTQKRVCLNHQNDGVQFENNFRECIWARPVEISEYDPVDEKARELWEVAAALRAVTGFYEDAKRYESPNYHIIRAIAEHLLKP
jgi:predicted MarR family transcription regulator